MVIDWAGQTLSLLPERALHWEEAATLVIADGAGSLLAHVARKVFQPFGHLPRILNLEGREAGDGPLWPSLRAPPTRATDG